MDTRNLVVLGSSTHRLGGKAHGAGHASPVSVGVGSGANLPGTVLRQHPSAEGCSVNEVSHLAIRPLFVSESFFFHEYGRRVGMVPRSSLKGGKTV